MDNYDFCAQFVERLASPNRPLTGLDYGTGRATIVSRLRAKGIAAFGCDVFYGGASGATMCRGVFRRRDCPRHARRPIPFDADTFDVVVSIQVFEHVPDPPRCSRRSVAVLRPGGVLLFLFPDRSIWREGTTACLSTIDFGALPPAPVVLGGVPGARAGDHHERKPVWKWSREACDRIHRWTYYRPYDQSAAMFGKLSSVTAHEAFWLDTRSAQADR